MKLKALAYILQPQQDGTPQLLFHQFDELPHYPLRLPGGGVETSETPLEALYREIEEEIGLTDLIMMRKLGVQRYYKPFIQDDVERHDYLLRPKSRLPESWSFVVQGEGDDAGDQHNYLWLTAESRQPIDPEHGEYLTADYIPEFFAKFGDKF